MAAASGGDAEAVAEPDGETVLDANSATAEQMAARGVPADVAQAVVDARPFADVTALNSALAGATSQDDASRLLASVFVPVNLNTATREEIALIPGMTDRMVGEFLEYRPYEDMAEFDREIGKYVDDEEVARLRRYVTL